MKKIKVDQLTQINLKGTSDLKYWPIDIFQKY